MKICKIIKIAAFVAATICLAASCRKNLDNQKDKYIDITSIRLNQESITLIKGSTEQLHVIIKPNNASDKSVTWSSQNDNIASVDENGLVTAKIIGNTVIKAISNFNAKMTASCAVEVVQQPVAITGLAVDPPSVVMKSGDTKTLILAYQPSNTTDRNVSWTSNDKNVVTVSDSGELTAKGQGSTTVVVTSKANASVSATVPVKVVEPVTQISIVFPNTESLNYNSGHYDLSVGESFPIRTTKIPEDSEDPIIYRSGDPEAVSVDENGVVRALKYKSTDVLVYVGSGTGTAAEVSIRVRPYDAPTAMVLSPRSNDTPMKLDGNLSGRRSEYIGVGCTQYYSVSVEPYTANQKWNLQSWSSRLTAYMEGTVLCVKAGTGQVSTSSNKVSTSVAFLTGGKELRQTFYISEYDPYYPKPGDGLYTGTDYAGRVTLIVHDGGWRGKDIFENSVSAAENKSKVSAMIGWIGNKMFTDDSGATSYNGYRWSGINSAQDGYEHGIAIPVNTDYLYASGGNTDHSQGMRFCLQSADLVGSHPAVRVSDKLTAYTNTLELKTWNDQNSGSAWKYQILPVFYCDSRSTTSSAGSGWYYGFSSSTELNVVGKMGEGCSRHSDWLLPTYGDLLYVFGGDAPTSYSGGDASNSQYRIVNSGTYMETVRTRRDAFKKCAKTFNGSVLTYIRKWWCSQQYDSGRAIAFTLDSNGMPVIECPVKTEYQDYYVLPIIYY